MVSTLDPGRRNPNLRELPEETPRVWDQYPPASWQVKGSQQLFFPVLTMAESGGNRIVRRVRAYRQGAKLDNTGSKEKVWNLMAKFSNEIEEPGLEGNGMPLYPDVLRAMLETIDLYANEAGDLVLPNRGPVRARIEDYSWQEHFAERNTATLTFTFVEDNEDNVDAASYSYPTVNANASQFASDIEDATTEIDAYDNNIANLKTLTNDLVALANAPAERRRDYETQAKLVIESSVAVLNAFSQSGIDGRDQFTEPDGDRSVRNLLLLQDSVARETGAARRGRPKLITVSFPTDRTLMSVAVQYGQSYTDILEVNSSLDPMRIPAGQTVKVFENV